MAIMALVWGVGKEKAKKYEGTTKKIGYSEKGVRKFLAISLSQ